MRMPLTTSTFPIFKISATGNDFLVVDLLAPEKLKIWQNEFAPKSRRELVREWCDRNEGLGADGLVFLESDSQNDFAWDFYNSDGGSAEMCGNAARGVSLYMQTTRGKSEWKFKTVVGIVNSQVHSASDIAVTLPALLGHEWDQLSNDTGSVVKFDFVRAGVPHAVVKTTDIAARSELREIAQRLKKESRFKKEGVNVTFLRATSPNSIESVTFERGVEDFTRACGTGAIAAAWTILRGDQNREVEVLVPGGRLTVIWKDGRPVLRGPAKVVAEMHVLRTT